MKPSGQPRLHSSGYHSGPKAGWVVGGLIAFFAGCVCPPLFIVYGTAVLIHFIRKWSHHSSGKINDRRHLAKMQTFWQKQEDRRREEYWSGPRDFTNPGWRL